ncbi:mercury(II) reductase [Anoxybacillus sp.]|uniref:mercury(II) reductase n=1 Tax=Anoxybacillus sp. TaxID=1872573 RepID=UPI0026288D10|nr:mercury(II) reductase [uncultured Anoxybacillus sp.]
MYRISELAKRCGVNKETIRYYEKRQLLPLPTRTEAGYRLYSDADTKRIQFIKRLQRLGFSLTEIHRLLGIVDQDKERCAHMYEFVSKKVEEVQKQIKDLQRVVCALQDLQKRCPDEKALPSKTLLRAGEINYLAKNHPFLGLHTSAETVDLSALIEQKNELVRDLRQAKYVNLINEYGFTLIQGEAVFLDETTVEVNEKKLSANRFLIATGASPAVPNIPGLADVDYVTSTTLLERKEVPKRLAVIGSGYIGIELGQLFHHLGSEVTLMQRSQRLLKTYEPEVSEAMTKALTTQGIRLLTGVSFERVEQDGNVKKIYIEVDEKKQVIEADELLIATGRTPNTSALRLEAAGVKTGSRGEIIVNDYLQTTNPCIYAAGDVTLGPQFVYVAAYEGTIAAANAVGAQNKKAQLDTIPAITFSSPAVATVGLTEQQAKEKGYEVKTSVLPLEAVPRAIVNHETIGVFKLVADAKTGKFLGVHIVAEHAGEVIYAATLAVKLGLSIDDLRETLAPYLTMSEGLKLAALTFDQDVEKLSCCAG